jgi:hypothetical protein
MMVGGIAPYVARLRSSRDRTSALNSPNRLER